jgi:Uma2 family endonuclease
MAETDFHRKLMVELIETLTEWFQDDPLTYVSGNILLFYEEGNRRRHVSPDVLVTHDVLKHDRDHYLLWEEGKAPDLVIELTSKTTKKEDVGVKYALYQDTLKVKEFILFDPFEEYLDPPFQGHKLVRGVYRPIPRVEDRIPSSVLGLHLERDDTRLRLYDPVNRVRLPTPAESRARGQAALLAEAKAKRAAQKAMKQAEEQRHAEAKARQEAEALFEAESKARQAAEAEAQRLREELDRLRGR